MDRVGPEFQKVFQEHARLPRVVFKLLSKAPRCKRACNYREIDGYICQVQLLGLSVV